MSAPREPVRSPVTPAGRLRATYGLSLESGESAEAKAKRIAVEQTVELPPELVPEELATAVVGRVEEVEAVGDGTWRATISYPAQLVGGSFSQLMNLLYGNISLLSGIRLLEVAWPLDLLAEFGGPSFGVQGLRELCGVTVRRPLTCVVSKPLGLSSRQLAHLVGEMARAGVDIIKDDHSLADQATAPFRERVRLCQGAVEEANASARSSTVYFPTLCGSGTQLLDDAEFLLESGCRGAVVLPFYQGLDTIAGLASTSGLALLAHPSGSGVFFGPWHGVAPEVYLGQLLRITGCDAVILPHVGGRFGMEPSTVRAILSRLVSELGSLRPSAPAPGGSVEPSGLTDWLELYGSDSVLVVGASVACADNPAAAAAELVAIVSSAFD